MATRTVTRTATRTGNRTFRRFTFKSARPQMPLDPLKALQRQRRLLRMQAIPHRPLLWLKIAGDLPGRANCLSVLRRYVSSLPCSLPSSL